MRFWAISQVKINEILLPDLIVSNLCEKQTAAFQASSS
jgi:hypothetical protein